MQSATRATGSNRAAPISVVLPEDVRRAAVNRAWMERISLSAWVREAVKERLNGYENHDNEEQ